MQKFIYNPPLTPYLEEIYRDDYITVVNKPSGLLSVPGKDKEYYDSAFSRVLEKYSFAQPCHRLDMATSGLLLFALSKKSESNLKAQFRDRLVEKKYQAIVWGKMGEVGETGFIDYPLICDWERRPKQKVCYQSGKKSLTFYEILEVLPDNKTRVLLVPHTGRSHQLRVHLMAKGFPIVGDRLYAHSNARKASDRLMLHSCYLKFLHPIKNTVIEIINEPLF